MVSLHRTIFGGPWSNPSGHKKYLICHVTSQNHVTEGPFNLRSRSSSLYFKRGIMAVLDAVYADKNHTKINREYTAKKRWLRGLLSHARTRGSPRIQK